MTQPDSSSEPRAPRPTPAELESEIARTRSELASTIDELTTRLDPRVQAVNVAHQARQAASDTGSFLSGGGLPEEDPRRARNVKILVGVVAVGVSLVAAAILRRRSSRA